MTDQKQNNYDASSIKVLEGLEAVRVRPGMYIGSTGIDGLHHMIWEIVDNAVDEVMGGFASNVDVTLTKNNEIIVEDDGRGIPIDKHPKTGRPTVETVMTVLHAGGKFDNSSYKVSGGLHGVGASVVNALSKKFEVTVVRDHIEYFVDFKDGGKLNHSLKKIKDNAKKVHGTTVLFYPDFSVMEPNEFDEKTILDRLQQLAYLNKNMTITFTNEKNDKKKTWHYEGGISQYVKDLNRDLEPLMSSIVSGEGNQEVKKPNDPNNETYSLRVEVAFQYNKGYNTASYSFCNNINTTEGGTHDEGFKAALVKVLNRYALEKKFIKETDDKFIKEDVLEGLTAIVSVKHPNPQYEGQTKKKLGNTEVRQVVNGITTEIFERYLLENPDDAKNIILKVIQAANGRKSAQEAKEATRRKSPFETSSLPGKLADCSSKDASICELYIVEGDSAGGSAKLGRNREFQAILPLRGKILNVEKAKTDKIFENAEISAMIMAIGGGVKPSFDVSKIRYDKIVIMTDADVDGAHIRILLLTFFFRFMPELIEQGHVYAAQPPLFKFSVGKKVQYFYSENELEAAKKANAHAKYTVQRYKGLGEMNPDQLWETTMDPTTRILHQITIDDAAIANKNFSMLMGDDVAPRRDFITTNAKYIKNLDI